MPCQKPFTIKHIPTECIDLKQIRQKYYQTTNLKQIFYQINPKNLLGYLKEVSLYSKVKKNTNYKCLNKNVCKRKSVFKEILMKKNFHKNIPKGKSKNKIPPISFKNLAGIK